MSEEMEQCDNCLKMFPQGKIATHFGYCRRNIKKCEKCGEMYDINFVDEHEQEFHKKVACEYCKKQFGTTDIGSHTKSCDQKPIFCQYCQLNVPPKQYALHLKQCESRTKKCDKCNKAIMNKEYLIHMTTCRGIVEVEEKPASRNYAEHIEQQRYHIEAEKKREAGRKNGYYGVYNESSDPYALRKKQVVKDNITKNFEKREIKSNYGIERPNVQNKAPQVRQKEPIRSYKDVGNKYPTRNDPTIKNYGSKEPIKYSSNQPRNMSSNRPLREDPPKMNSRQTKPTTYKVNQIKIPSSKQIPTRNQPISKPASYNRPTGSSGNQNLSKPTYQYSRNAVKHSNVPTRDNPEPKRTPIFKPQEYERPRVQQTIPEPAYQAPSNGFLENEDEELQRAIMMSIGEKKVGRSGNIPKQFESEDLMSQSFLRDIDVEKQRAMYEEAQRGYKNSRY